MDFASECLQQLNRKIVFGNQYLFMQKLLKSKNNYKKIVGDREQPQKHVKHSQTLSTNESKIHHQPEKSNSALMHYLNINSIISKNLNRYGTSDDLFYLSDFEQNFGQARSRQKILLKDMGNHKDNQVLQRFYSSSKSVYELNDLFEYYKYYINNPILYPKQHFKVLYNFYQKKKYLQYKRLKAVLDLDDSRNSETEDSINQNISLDPKRNTKENTKTFYVMNLIETDNLDQNNHSESKAFLELQEILSKIEFSRINTPRQTINKSFLQNHQILFKKKKITPSSSYKNTIVKKNKKQSANNSNSPVKKLKFTKSPKEPYPSKFLMDCNQLSTIKSKKSPNTKKLRHASNLSMGDLENKNNFINSFSPKKRYKKRMNSCETVISKNCIKQKPVLDKKYKKSQAYQSNQQKTEQTKLQEFKTYLKIISSNYRKSKQKKVTQQDYSHSSKFRKQNTPQQHEQNFCLKRTKKKVACKNSSGKSSLQKSPERNSKQNLIEESILNLKKKIQLAKETIKNSNANSSSNLHQNKKNKSTQLFVAEKKV